MQTRVVNFRTDPECDGVWIQRPTVFGNPFPVCRGRSRAQSLAQFEQWLRDRVATDSAFAAAVRALHGRTLICGCKPKDCHGDVLAAVADELAITE